MAAKSSRVHRPLKMGEYSLVFATRDAEKSWTDLLAMTRNALVDAWGYLTQTPLQQSERHHPLRGNLEFLTHRGERHRRWQHELPGGARIWFYVDGSTVWLVEVHTHHPNSTK